jgi:polyribonucleotide nucleotidyltransferase
MQDYQVFETNLGGRPIVFEIGKFAKQANGSVLVRYGDTVVLATASASSEPREGIDFFPLTVDYEERLYAAGKIPGGFIKREGRPSEKATLTARLIDRPIRPLFPKGFRNDVQVVATVLSVDKDNSPDIPALIGASVALSISDIPFEGPISAVTIGLIDDEFIVNPTVEQDKVSKLHLTVSGTKDAILMVEAGAKEISEEQMIKAMTYAHNVIKENIQFQEQIMAKVGKEKKEINLHIVPEEIEVAVREYATDILREAVINAEKTAREAAIKSVKDTTIAHFKEIFPDKNKDVKEILDKIIKEQVRKMIIHQGMRPDGRELTEIRPISCEVGLLPRPHGSGLFTRGQTQVLSVVTLGTVSDEQIIDGLGAEESKRYIHHYNFPPYSVGETRPMRGPGRREIGHGALAERALLPMIPDETEFPYTIRIVSDVLESNGSSSMASVCGSTLSLMDAGVPIQSPVAGVAMGLVKEGEGYAILTDIQGLEDALGDMDFKVAGTEKGITALQMDMKVAGVSEQILEQALAQAKEGRLFILNKMLATLPTPRQELSKYAPRIITLEIHPDKIRDVIGPGGKTIKKIVEQTGVKIDIEDDGRIFIASADSESSSKAVKMVEQLTKDVQAGETYLGRVTRIMNFGAFVEVLPGKEGLVHISQLALERVNKVEDVVSIGDEILVKVTEIDRQGRINLSRKEILRAEQKQQ